MCLCVSAREIWANALTSANNNNNNEMHHVRSWWMCKSWWCRMALNKVCHQQIRYYQLHTTLYCQLKTLNGVHQFRPPFLSSCERTQCTTDDDKNECWKIRNRTQNGKREQSLTFFSVPSFAASEFSHKHEHLASPKINGNGRATYRHRHNRNYPRTLHMMGLQRGQNER